MKDIDWSVPKAEVGYFIDKDYEGKGIVSKSLSMLISHGFETLKINKLYLRVATDNYSSQKVAEKNGFMKAGVLRKDFKTSEGNLIDVYYYDLVRDSKT